MKLLGRQFDDVAFVGDLGFRVRPIDETTARQHERDAQGVADRRNEYYARREHQMQHDRAAKRARNPRPKRFAIDFEIVEKPVLLGQVQHFSRQ